VVQILKEKKDREYKNRETKAVYSIYYFHTPSQVKTQVALAFVVPVRLA
jgi:hypothetical protein